MAFERLSAAASFVRRGDILCDIGSDHAYLPIMLIENGVITSAISCDLRPLPLERGKENAAKRGVGGIDFVLSDGFAAVCGAFTAASICGMGGELIARIIADGGEKAHTRLILQPMTACEKLRAFLWSHGFSIADERFAVEDGKAYAIMLAEYTGENESHGYSELYLGAARPDTPEFAAWKKKTLASALKRLKGATATGSDTSELEELIGEAGVR